ncbi:4'-phosphopantetheinyl transferase family protein [Pedobacter duraquae]|uniref:4'-phosphopantetheinyl transferase superfamily protein n=1 Tax=Pedobacter duraquae TaxID=425511 RepID=A0A4R6IPV5_9SPHI|nr:4'-phosphopantetheinyl transferase superfamily protein [Pedobacter duraquae]TDO24339.1 4'-phosphopantetheinyl transferase superfamily protein [Pedobacter duraquae]
MIGNDLVDLRCALKESNWKRKGFLEKLFTPSEQAHILSAEDPFLHVWQYWTMKESAYKIYSRITKTRSFAPTRLACTYVSNGHGTVIMNSLIYFTKTEINGDYIHTIAAESSIQLEKIKIEIIQYCGEMPVYASKNPSCVSHHGQFLALVY